MIHNRELAAYELLCDIGDGFPLPAVYGAERATATSAGWLLLKDLGAQSAPVDASYGFTAAQCFCLTKHIANMQVSYRHAISHCGRHDDIFCVDTHRCQRLAFKALQLQAHVASVGEEKWRGHFTNIHADDSQRESLNRTLNLIDAYEDARECADGEFARSTTWPPAFAELAGKPS